MSIFFFTNYDSAKGRQLSQEARCALVFYWGNLNRQVRIRGRVEQVSRKEAAEYFRVRPRDSRLGAWASDQSQPVADRAAAQARVNQLRAEHPGCAHVCWALLAGGQAAGGLRAVHLEVDRNNAAAMKLYTRAGFRPREDYMLQALGQIEPNPRLIWTVSVGHLLACGMYANHS